MHYIPSLRHVETGGFNAGRRIRPSHIELTDAVCLNEFGKSNALTSEAFSAFIAVTSLSQFYVAGADATACVKSTCFNMTTALNEGRNVTKAFELGCVAYAGKPIDQEKFENVLRKLELIP